LFASRHESIV